MSLHLEWQTPLMATTVHWLSPPVATLELPAGPESWGRVVDAIQPASWPRVFWQHLVVLANDQTRPLDWIQLAWQRTVAHDEIKTAFPGSVDHLLARFAEQLEEAHQAMQSLKPNLAGELALRCDPLRNQWLARGPGFWARLERRLSGSEPPMPYAIDQLRLVGLLPRFAGAGHAHPLDRAVSIEVVLTNRDDRLPELLRLAWLITCVRLGASHEHRTDGRALLDALGLTASIAHELDWTTDAQATASRALTAWHVVPEDEQQGALERLERYLNAEPPS